jgi:hypothetical protein
LIPATLIAAILALAVFGTLLARVSPPHERTLLIFCVIATCPMCWVMFHWVRLPLDQWLQPMLGSGRVLPWIRSAYAPFTEEPAKLWPLALPFVRRAVDRGSFGRFAFALGLGFGLGEIFTVAGLLSARRPEISGLPWYLLTGFIYERFMVCAIHPAMTAVALAGWRRGGSMALGLSLAMLAHWLTNFPITMAQRGWLGPNAAISQAIVSLWVFACFAAAVGFMASLLFPQVRLRRKLLGEAICPGCGQRYERGVFTGLNAGGNRRYERCPFCRHWHWTQRAKPTKPGEGARTNESETPPPLSRKQAPNDP